MLANDQAFEIRLDPNSNREIEQFVDAICDRLFINDTYYGNILISLTSLYEMMSHSSTSGALNISWNTDHQHVSIKLQPIDHQLIKQIEQKEELDQEIGNEVDKLNFLLHTLVDRIGFEGGDSITLEFDIGALHNKVYRQRQAELNAYFNHRIEEHLKKSNDQV